MTREEYERFYDAVIHAESATVHDFDKEKFFEGCLPIEVMAHRGADTMRFGPMKPVGLFDPRAGRQPYAVVQLRQDNIAGDHYSLVGFQTQLKWGEQERVLRLIPGLEHAEFVRFGMVHRNTYVNGPAVLPETRQMRKCADVLSSRARSRCREGESRPASGLLAGGTRPQARLRRSIARARADDHGLSGRWRFTSRMRTRRTTSRATSRSASCRRSTGPVPCLAASRRTSSRRSRPWPSGR